MATRSFTSLVARANASVPGCPYPTIKTYIRDAAIKVCERTSAWRYQIPKFDLSPGVYEYPFSIPTNSEVHTIFAAVVNDAPLDLINMDTAIAQYPEWADLYSGEDPADLWSETDSGSLNSDAFNEEAFNGAADFTIPDAFIALASNPRACTMVTPQRYIILPMPDAEIDYSMRMFVALKPLRDATSMDAEAFNELEDVILHKTLEDLLVLPNKPWTNYDLASFHSQKYGFLVGEKRARANLGHVRGSLSVKTRVFA